MRRKTRWKVIEIISGIISRVFIIVLTAILLTLPTYFLWNWLMVKDNLPGLTLWDAFGLQVYAVFCLGISQKQNTRGIEVMTIDNQYYLGDIVYLKTDNGQSARIYTGILIVPGDTQYRLMCGSIESWHFAFEISSVKNYVIENKE